MIDFKSDGVGEEEIHERTERYRPQIEDYRRAASAITGLSSAHVHAKLVFLEAGKVIDL